MTQCHLGRRFSALPRRDIIITATAKAESSFAGTGRGGPGRREPLVDRLLGRAAPQETGCANKRARCRGSARPHGAARPTHATQRRSINACANGRIRSAFGPLLKNEWVGSGESVLWARSRAGEA